MSVYPEHEGPGRRIRRQTGAVGLIISGERPTPKTGADIVEVARDTEFFEEARIETEYEGGSIEVMPRAMVSDSIATALTQGLLLGKFTITGSPPKELQLLDSGTYYLHVYFVEGPDFDEGRWIGRIVTEEGETQCLVPGVEVKQIITFSLDAQEHEEHSRPRMHAHGFGVGEAAELFGRSGKHVDRWQLAGANSQLLYKKTVSA